MPCSLWGLWTPCAEALPDTVSAVVSEVANQRIPRRSGAESGVGFAAALLAPEDFAGRPAMTPLIPACARIDGAFLAA